MSVALVECQGLLLNVRGSCWMSVALVECQWLLLNVRGSCWMSVALVECQWLLLNVSGSCWMSGALVECQWLLLNVRGSYYNIGSICTQNFRNTCTQYCGHRQIPVTTRYEAFVLGRSFARFAVSIPAGGVDVCCGCFVLSVGGLCVGLVTLPEDSYWLWWVRVWS
jgi:hypothetical protein